MCVSSGWPIGGAGLPPSLMRGEKCKIYIYHLRYKWQFYPAVCAAAGRGLDLISATADNSMSGPLPVSGPPDLPVTRPTQGNRIHKSSL